MPTEKTEKKYLKKRHETGTAVQMPRMPSILNVTHSPTVISVTIAQKNKTEE